MKVLQNAGDRLGVAGCSGEVLLKRQRVVGSEKLALKWTYHTNLDIVLQDAGLRAQIGLLHCQLPSKRYNGTSVLRWFTVNMYSVQPNCPSCTTRRVRSQQMATTMLMPGWGPCSGSWGTVEMPDSPDTDRAVNETAVSPWLMCFRAASVQRDASKISRLVREAPQTAQAALLSTITVLDKDGHRHNVPPLHYFILVAVEGYGNKSPLLKAFGLLLKTQPQAAIVRGSFAFYAADGHVGFSCNSGAKTSNLVRVCGVSAFEREKQQFQHRSYAQALQARQEDHLIFFIFCFFTALILFFLKFCFLLLLCTVKQTCRYLCVHFASQE